MTDRTDPFVHHPELRDRIAPPETSFFRGFNVDDLIAQFPEMEKHRDWTHSDADREAIRAQALTNHDGDLWVFAYGSLMWDPALRFQEVRRVHAPGYGRRFILFDDKGGRGSENAPGLMAALDRCTGCDGLAFRIAAADIETETEILFRREMIAPSYLPAFIALDTGDTTLTALTFLADHDVPDIRPDIPRSDQVRFIATGEGFLGTSHAYLANVVSQLAHLGIKDDACSDLLREVEAYRAALTPGDPAS